MPLTVVVGWNKLKLNTKIKMESRNFLNLSQVNTKKRKKERKNNLSQVKIKYVQNEATIWGKSMKWTFHLVNIKRTSVKVSDI